MHPFKIAYLEKTSPKPMEESLLLARFCESIGLEHRFFTRKQVFRRQLALTKESFVAGQVTTMQSVLKQLGLAAPRIPSYPQALRPFLRRSITHSNLAEVLRSLQHGTWSPCFVKPRYDSKRFTGFILNDLSDLYQVQGSSKTLEIVCSEICHFESEWRAFVLNGETLGLKLYRGYPEKSCDKPFMNEAVRAFETSGLAPSAYALDFGVLSTGQTALVEWNDAYSLGAYGLDHESYGHLLFHRWEELTRAL